MNTSLGDILEDYENLIPITILGISFEVPENNTFLRLLQFLRFDISYGKFCWNGDCKNCAFRYRGADGKERTALGCQTIVQENMEIIRLPADTTPGDSSPASGG